MICVGNRYTTQFGSAVDKGLPIFAIVCTMCTDTADNSLLEKFEMSQAVRDGNFEAVSFLPLEIFMKWCETVCLAIALGETPLVGS
jgi:hypothetical protein